MSTLGFEIYKTKVVKQLADAGFTGDAKEFATALDMSYDDLVDDKVPVEKWDLHIACDLADYRLDNPDQFPKQH